MRISDIQVKKRKDSVTISAQITFQGEKPQIMYFKVPREYESFLVADASPFFAALLLPAMKRKESIVIEDTVSAKLLSNANKIMKLFGEWKVGLSNVQIESKKANDAFTPAYAACFFSAGVDSFTTFLKNKELIKTKDISSDEKITHLILVHGFDIELGNKALFTSAKKNIQHICDEEGVNLITVETNLRSIIEQKLIWDFSHGGALAAVALLLRKNLKKVSIAGAVKRHEVFPYGTHPKLDPLWGTETLTIAHDGTEYNRLEKIERFIVPSKTARTYLRVCNQNRKNEYNCGTCFKCLTTMLELASLQALENTPAFRKSLDAERVRKMYFDYDLKYHTLAIALLKRFRKIPDTETIQEALQDSLERSKKRSVVQKIVKVGAKFDQKYFNRRVYSYLFIYQKQDRRLLFKVAARLGMIK